MTVKEWIEEEQGKHFCQCGCGQEIVIKDYHHYYGIPNYIVGHSNAGRVVSDETKEKTRQALTGHLVLEATKQKIREKRKFQITTEETKQKMSEAMSGEKHWNYGKHHSKETRRKMRENHAHLSGKNHPMYGKHPPGRVVPKEERERISAKLKGHPVSEETRQKLREKGKSQVFTEEAKKNMSDALRGRPVSEETRRKLSKANKGKNSWNYGKPVSTETKEKRSRAMKRHYKEHPEDPRKLKGEKNPNHGKCRTAKQKENISKGLKRFFKEHPEAVEKSRENRKHQTFPNHHTKPELAFEEICEKYDLHFKYVGDGSLWIGKDRTLNPDFIQADGQKIVVEIFGDYWHSPLLNPKLSETANLNFRKRHYKKYGWASYFIWDTDLLRPDAEQFVLNMLKGVGTPK